MNNVQEGVQENVTTDPRSGFMKGNSGEGNNLCLMTAMHNENAESPKK